MVMHFPHDSSFHQLGDFLLDRLIPIRCIPLLFCHMGWHPSRMFKRCSAMERGMPVLSAGLQANISKFSFSKLQSSILPISDRLPPIVTICFGYSGWIATLIPSAAVGSWGGSPFGASATILHSTGIMVLLWIVNMPSSTGNFSIPFAEDGTVQHFLG
ncbi:hypothetical protein Tco_0314373 [Tanacetum coccineum]